MERSGVIVTPLTTVIPALVSFLFVLIADLPISVFGGHVPPPLLALMPVYFWGLVRPDLMPPGLAFAVGLMEDMFSGGAPGIWGASFVAAYALIDAQRDSFAGLSGIGAILGFATALSVACGTAYLIACVYYWQLPPVSALLSQAVVSTLYYIPVAFVLVFLHRRFVGAQRSDL